MRKKIPVKESTLNWLELNWEKKEANGVILLTLPNQPKHYYEEADKLAKLQANPIKSIKKLNLFSINPIFQVALFPEEIFVEKTKVPFLWATACVRSTDGKNSNVLCFKYQNKPSKTEPKKSPSNNQKREVIHEALHIFLSQQLDYYGFPKAINEGFCEFVPRILLDFQKNIKESNEYLQSLQEKDLVLFKDIDTKGIASFSKEKINKNPAYASAFLGVTWLVNQFSQDKVYLFGAREFVKFLTQYNDANQLYSAIKEKTSVDFRNSKQPLLEGIKLIQGITR